MKVITGKLHLIFCLTVFVVGCSLSTLAQTTVMLDLTSGTSQDLYVSNFPGWENLNLNPDPDFAAIAWTGSGGIPYVGRSMAQFDLSTIPAGVTITNALLNLYGNPNPEHSPGHSSQDGPNIAWLRRIVSAWDENTTTWNTQPATTTLNEVLLPMSSTSSQDYLNINVTALVQDMYNDQANSYGFFLQLYTEQFYRALNFESSNGLDDTKRPSLVITYTSDTCLAIPINSGSGQDLYISNFPGWETLNLNPDPDFAAIAWTGSGGIPFLGRAMAQFDLSFIPSNASITSASLSLYGNPNPEHSPGHSTQDGSNVATLRRILTAWDENTTTWNTQPSSTTQHEVLLPQSSLGTQDYPDIDVTDLVQDMYNDPANSYGFMVQLVTEQYYRALNFASGNCTDSSKQPRLEVCYSISTSSGPEVSKPDMDFEMYPVPAKDVLTITLTAIDHNSIALRIYTCQGKLVLHLEKMPTTHHLDISTLPQGLYIVEVSDGKRVLTKKFVVH